MPGADPQVTQQNQTQNQSRNSTTNPWESAQPLLQRLLGQYGGMDTGPTSGQTSAITGLRNTLTNMPDYTGVVQSGADKLLGANFDPQINQMNSAYGGLQNNLGGVAAGNNLDPMSQPGMSDWMDTLGADITKQVKGVYAGSGRDPSGAGSFAGSLGRGLTQGMAPVIANQANVLRQNQMDAAKTLYGAGGATAQGTAGLQGSAMDRWMQGMGVYGQLPGMATQQGSGLLNLANSEAGIPWGNLGQILGAGTSLGGMGGTSSGTGMSSGNGTTTRTQPQSLMSNILGGTTAAATLLPLMFSDENLKEDITQVGLLNDGQPVFSYKYRGDPKPRIGLIAQEVEKVRPDAVVDIGGFKAVNYDKATERARHIGGGLLDPWLEAA